MFKIFKRLLFTFLILMVIIGGSLYYVTSKVKNNLINNFSTVSNDYKIKSNDKNPNPSDSSNDFSIDDNNLNISPEISNILSDENKYDLAIKYDDINTLVSFDSSTNETTVANLSHKDNFDHVAKKADKYINFKGDANYSFNDLKALKDKFYAAGVSEKFSIVKEVLNNTDTNLTESDLIDLYLKYKTQK